MPKLRPKVHNAFAILSQPDDPTRYYMSNPPLQKADDKTIIPPDPCKHCRQRKIARRQHIKQTRLRDSDGLFLDNSITLAEDKRTSLAKANDNNKKRMAINDAHNKRGTTRIGFPQRGRNAAYSLSSAFNRTIKKLNKDKHVSFATHPVMVTYKRDTTRYHLTQVD